MPELYLAIIIAVFAGAVIGYVTNALAIRMLFRPYREIRLGRFVLPFTPGIIPKQRVRLATSLGRMVSQSLFNPESLDKHISSPLVRSKIEQALGSAFQALGGSSKAGKEALVHAPLSLSEVFGTAEDQQELLVGLVRAVLGSPRFRSALETGSHGLVKVLGAMPLVSILPNPEARQGILAGLERDGIKPSHSLVAQRLVNLVLAEFFERDESLDSILGAGFKVELRSLLGSLYPEAGTMLLSWLESKEMRGELTSRGRILLKQIFDKLNMPQRLLMGMVGYDRKLDDMMPSIIDDVLHELRSALSSEKVRTEFLMAVDRLVDGFLPLKPRDALIRLNLDPDVLAGSLMGWVAGRPGRTGLALRLVSGFFDLVERNGEKELGLALEEILGIEPGQLSAYVADRAGAFLDKPEAVRTFTTRTVGLLFKVLAAKPAVDSVEQDCPPADIPGDLVRELSRVGIQLLRLWLPHLVKEFDIDTMVRERVMELDMAELEKMIMGLAKSELEWINILGAILGAFIGLLQVVLSRLLA